MQDKHWLEYYEGKKAFDRTKLPDQKRPYWSVVDSERARQWLEGWEAAKLEDKKADRDDGGEDDRRGDDKADRDNHSNQMNPNNSAYHASRG